MKKFTLWTFFVLVMVLNAGCASTDTQANDQRRFVYGLTLMPSGFDPHVNASAELTIPLRSVYDTLVYYNRATGQYIPGLATHWEVSPDGLMYTFYLREDVQFHDGTEFNAAAVGSNLDRITAVETGSQKAVFMLGPYNNYELVDRYTIRLNLTEPYAPLLDSLSQVYLGIASPSALAEYDLATYQYHQVGTGPYRMVEYVPGERFVITRNENYNWAPAIYAAPENPIETIEFRFYEDPATRSVALESGEVQMIGEIPPIDAQLLAGNAAVRLYPVAIPGQPLQFLMNTERFPTDIRAVRQALIMGTNRAAIADTIFRDYSPPAFGPISAATQFYTAEVEQLYPFDSERVGALLEAAGFTATDEQGVLILPSTDPNTGNTAVDDPNAQGGETQAATGIPLQLILVVPPWGQTPDVAQLLQSQWRPFGIDVEIRQVPGLNQLRQVVETGEYNLIAMNLFGLDPSSQLAQFYSSDGPFNWIHFSDPSLDAYLREAARVTDPAQRANLFGQVQLFIMDQALLLPVREYVNLNGAAATVANISFDAQGWSPLLYNFSWNILPGGE